MSRPSTLYGPLYSGASTHPKIEELSIALDVPMFTAFGIACTIWEKALTQCPTGRWRRWDATTIAQLVGWTEDAGRLLSALLSSGLLRLDGSALCIHDWDQYGGASLAARTARVKATKEWRKKRDPKSIGDVTPPASEMGVVRCHSDISQGGGEPSSLLSSSLLSSDPDLPDRNPDPEPPPLPTAAPPPVVTVRAAPPQPAARLAEPRGMRAGVVGYGTPTTIEGVLATPARDGSGLTLGEAWRKRWPNFGRPGALTFDEAVAGPFVHWRSMEAPWAWPDMFIAKAVPWINELHMKSSNAVAAQARETKVTAQAEEPNEVHKRRGYEEWKRLRDARQLKPGDRFAAWWTANEDHYRNGGSRWDEYIDRAKREIDATERRGAMRVVKDQDPDADLPMMDGWGDVKAALGMDAGKPQRPTRPATKTPRAPSQAAIDALKREAETSTDPDTRERLAARIARAQQARAEAGGFDPPATGPADPGTAIEPSEGG